MSYNIIIYLSLFIFISIIVFYVIYITYSKPINENNVYFMNNEETKQFFLKDDDRYVSNLSKYDIYARRAKTNKEYLELISNSASNFSFPSFVK